MGLHMINGLTGVKVFDGTKSSSYEDLDCTEDTGASPTGVPDDTPVCCFFRVINTDAGGSATFTFRGPNGGDGNLSYKPLVTDQNDENTARAVTDATGAVSWSMSPSGRDVEVWLVGWFELSTHSKDYLTYSLLSSSGSLDSTVSFEVESESGVTPDQGLAFLNLTQKNSWSENRDMNAGLYDVVTDMGYHTGRDYGITLGCGDNDVSSSSSLVQAAISVVTGPSGYAGIHMWGVGNDPV